MRASSSSAVAALTSAVEAAASTHLLALAADTTRGQPIEEAAAALEAAADARTGNRNARSGRLIGTWSLVYTNSRAVVGNTGLTGAGRMMLGARLNALRVCYDLGGAAWAEEQLSSLALLRVRNRLTGTWAVGPAKDGNTVEQTYAELETHPGGMKLRSDSKAVVDVTYLDDEWRIARAPQSRDLFAAACRNLAGVLRLGGRMVTVYDNGLDERGARIFTENIVFSLDTYTRGLRDAGFVNIEKEEVHQNDKEFIVVKASKAA